MSDEGTVRRGYDRMADQYLSSRDPDDPVTEALLDAATGTLPGGSAALDLGCGAGVPVTQWLARRFLVTGVDVSARQVELGREHVPQATFMQASMTTVAFPPATFDVIVAFYSIIHVPRRDQAALLHRIHDWLRPGGVFLASWAVHAWEGTEEDWEGWGAPMWWSHYDAETNLRMLRRAGFRIASAETRTSGTETWLWVTAHS